VGAIHEGSTEKRPCHLVRSSSSRCSRSTVLFTHPCRVCVASKSCSTVAAHSFAPDAAQSAVPLRPRIPAAWHACAECSSARPTAGQAASTKHHGSYVSRSACASEWPQLAAFCKSCVQLQKRCDSDHISPSAIELSGFEPSGSSSRERSSAPGSSASPRSLPATHSMKDASCSAAIVAFHSPPHGRKSRRVWPRLSCAARRICSKASCWEVSAAATVGCRIDAKSAAAAGLQIAIFRRKPGVD